MKRRLLNSLALASLLLCVAVAVLWVLGRARWDVLNVRLPKHGVYVATDRNGIRLGWWRLGRHDIFEAGGPGVRHRALKVSVREQQRQVFPPHFRFAGFYLATRPIVPKSTAVGVPTWFLLMMFAALPVVRFVPMAHRRRRRVTGLCHRCSYDLRATPDKCPECGTVAVGVNA